MRSRGEQVSGYLRDIALRKQLEEKVKEATKTRQQAEDEINLARQILDAAKGIDADTSKAQGSLAEATAAMGSKDYKVALEKALEAKERGHQVYRDRVVAILTSGRSQLELAHGMGSDVSEGETLLRRAEDAYSSEDYVGAIDAARKAWKKTEKVLHEHQSAQFSKAQALVLAAKALGRDVGAAEYLLSRARGAVETSDYESALNFTREGIDGVTADLRGEFERAFADGAALTATTREMGADSARAESLLERARGDVERLEFEKAFNALKQSRSESERGLGRNLDAFLAQFPRQAERADRTGADTGRARGEFSEAEREVRRGHLQEGATLGRRALELLTQAQLDRIAARIADTREKIVAARQLGADIQSVLNFLKLARQASQERAFEEGLENVDRAEAELDRIIGEHRLIEERVQGMYGALADAESLGASTTSARRLLDRARLLLQEAQPPAASEALSAAQVELDRAAYERTMQVAEQGETILTFGERAGADLSRSRATLNDAIGAGENRQYSASIELATRARSQAEEAIERHFADARGALKASLQFLGDDAASVRTILAKSESAQAAKDLEGALSFLGDAHRVAEGKMRDRAIAFHEALRLSVELGLDLSAVVAGLETTLKEATALIGRGRYPDAIGLEGRAGAEMANMAESAFNLLKQKLVDARNVKIDIDPMRDLLKRSKVALGEGHYAEGYRLMKECNDLVNRATGMYRQAHTAMQSAAALVAEAKKRGVDVSKVGEMLIEGKKALERMEFERARDFGNRAKGETAKLMVLYASAQRIISGRERFELATQLGLDVPQLRNQLDEAKEAMKSKEYDRALRLSDNLARELGDAIRTKVAAMISAAESTTHGARVSVARQRDALAKARELLEKDEFAQAAELAMRTRDELERLGRGLDEASAKTARAREAIAEIEAMGLIPENSKRTLEAAESSLQRGRVDEAGDLAGKALSDLDAESEKNVAQAMRRFQESIGRARREGIDTRSAEKIFEKAREFLAARQYRQALALAMQSESETERLTLQQSIATNAIENVEKKLATLGTPLRSVRSMVDDARRALQEGDFVRALDIAIRANDDFSVGRELVDEALAARARAGKLIAAASQIEADTTRIDAAIRAGAAALDAGNAEGARASFVEALELGLTVCKVGFAARLERGRQYGELGRRLEMDASGIPKKYSEAQTQVEAENFASAVPLIEEADKAAQKALADKVSERLSEAEATLLHAKRFDADTGDAEELLRRASAALLESDFERTLSLIEESQGQVESRRLVEKRFVDLTYKAESTIRRARKFGIDVRAAEQALQVAIGAKKTDAAGAMAHAEESYRLAWQAVEAFAPSVAAHLVVQEPKVNEWSDATLALTNVGRALAKDIRIRILGDADVEGLRDVASIRAKGTEILPLKVRMGNPGTIPLAIQVASKRVFDDKEYSQEIVAQVVVGITAREEINRQIRAESESRCPICKGLIKPGHAIARCNCSREFHELCAARVGTCPVCFKPLGRGPGGP